MRGIGFRHVDEEIVFLEWFPVFGDRQIIEETDAEEESSQQIQRYKDQDRYDVVEMKDHTEEDGSDQTQRQHRRIDGVGVDVGCRQNVSLAGHDIIVDRTAFTVLIDEDSREISGFDNSFSWHTVTSCHYHYTFFLNLSSD